MFTDEAEIGCRLRHHDLSNLDAIRRVNVDAVDALASESRCTPDVAVDVCADTIVETDVLHGKLPVVGQPAAIVLNGKGVNLRLLVGEMRGCRVCDVERPVVGREAETVRLLDLVVQPGDATALGINVVDRGR